MNEFEQNENLNLVSEPQPVQKPKKKPDFFKWGLAIALCFSVCFGTALAFSVPYIVKHGGAGTEKGTIITRSNAAVQAQETISTDITPGQELTTQEIAAMVGPAVVSVENYAPTYSYYSYQSSGDAVSGTGSGVIISKDGYIVTNYHVIENAKRVNVVLNSGENYTAKIIGADETSDLALLKIEASDLTYAVFGDSSAVTVGDRAVAIGNPLGNELMGTVTQGIISAVNRTVQIENRTMTLLQTDAAINSGNSGGALINAYGEVVGINSAKMAASGVEGLGFAIPSNTVSEVVDDLKNYGYVRGRLTIGIAGTNITEKMAGYYDLPMGFYVQEVYAGTGAAAAGLKPGDIIIRCDGTVVQNIDDINAIKQKHSVGDTMEMEIVRGDKKISVKVVLQEQKPETAW